MTYKAKIENGMIVFRDFRNVKIDLAKLEGKEIKVDIKKFVKSRTELQNNALHLWYYQLADVLNASGLDVTKTLSRKVDHPWTPTLIKELIWRPIMQSMNAHQSTTQMTTTEPDQIFDVINRYLGEQFGVECPPWPSMESLIN